jgi:hypothetical protein
MYGRYAVHTKVCLPPPHFHKKKKLQQKKKAGKAAEGSDE